MMKFIRPRWRKPAGVMLAGVVFASAWAIRGGPRWWLFVTLVMVAALARAVALYLWAKEDDDVGALAGSRADERQKLVSQRSWALSGRFAMTTAFVGLTVAVALNAAWWWPFLAILAVTGFGYLLGLSSYGIAQEEPGDSSGTGYQVQSPLNS
jgi:hypothetical protein